MTLHHLRPTSNLDFEISTILKIRVPSGNILSDPEVNRLKDNGTDKSVNVVTNKPGKHDISMFIIRISQA